ncbi:phenylalanine--tRNA ligase subunit alpha [Patescibacteria group bacterium]|nr:phenylalanine--tRNA ligase subunit alpha [Patescibacteria group bacterium]
MEKQLNLLKVQCLESISKINNLHDLQELEVRYVGRKGELTMILRGVKDLSADQRPLIGQLGNQVKNELDAAFAARKLDLEKQDIAKKLHDPMFDVTAPGPEIGRGHIHPLSQVQQEVEEIFNSMGFAVMDGPEVESEYYNFEGLNIPGWHPARDMQDTFFIKGKEDKKHGRMVLRTHTSPVQVRTMEKFGAPLRVIVPGRTFRYEATDASHDTTFYQVEGLLIDKDISISHLKGVIKEFLTRLFKKEVSVRFRPGYFPFVEPGLEVDFSCLICGGKGCRVCKHTGWVEFLGAGMVHENVLKAGGIDPKEWQGWAFGFGLTRLAMMRHGIDDIRLLSGGDLRFINQF